MPLAGSANGISTRCLQWLANHVKGNVSATDPTVHGFATFSPTLRCVYGFSALFSFRTYLVTRVPFPAFAGLYIIYNYISYYSPQATRLPLVSTSLGLQILPLRPSSGQSKRPPAPV